MVTPISSQPKHTAHNIYPVTAASLDLVTAQKILHPLSSAPTKIMSKQYIIKPKNVQILHCPPTSSGELEADLYLPPVSVSTSDWNPISKNNWTDDSDEDDSANVTDLVHLPGEDNGGHNDNIGNEGDGGFDDTNDEGDDGSDSVGGEGDDRHEQDQGDEDVIRPNRCSP